MTAGFDRITLRDKRNKRGLTQAELGRILGVSFQAVSQWERGETTPTIDLLPVLAAALHCDIGDLFYPLTPDASTAAAQ